uniref:Uncharacterized protein n=1 Tax=Arion vulgaris TaxID=1028688 RepID=A0A0B6Z609_9EUPU
MKLLLACLSVVYYLTASVSSQSSECTNDIQECANVYITDIEKHARDRNIDLICGDLNTFVGCIFSLKCDLSESQKKSYIEETREQIADANINCDIDYTGNSDIGTRHQ